MHRLDFILILKQLGAQMDLEQRTEAWHAARRGKLTASNLGALLGQVSYTSRAEAFRRALGTDDFQGNEATEWGTVNEPNGIAYYEQVTGNKVIETGLHTHPNFNWIAGSPDGLVGTEGMVEIKCPYYKRTPHAEIPGHYYMQINALLECTGRDWCDYVCWTPQATSIYRVYRDTALFNELWYYYSDIYMAIRGEWQSPPPLGPDHKKEIAELVRLSMWINVNREFWSRQTLRDAQPSSDPFDEMLDAPPDGANSRKRSFVSFNDDGLAPQGSDQV